MGAFIKIQKNDSVKTVSNAAYKSYYKDFGWEIVEGEKPSTSQTKKKKEVAKETEKTVESEDVNDSEDEVADEVADEEWEEAIAEESVEKPISEMNREELIAKAESLGLSVTNEGNKKIREMIKEVM